MKPYVSVIMPAYNGEKYVEQAINSILNQTCSDLELIIVDDGSTDHTSDIIKGFDDPRIIVLNNDCNKGIAYSTNRAISKCRGKYIALMDDDDISTSQRLEWQIDFLDEHEEIDILGGRSAIIDEKGRLISIEGSPRHNPYYIKALLLFRWQGFSNCTAMIRNDFIKKNQLSYRENCLGMQDFKFYIDSSKIGLISAIDRLLLHHRMHSLNETTRQLKTKERALLYSKFQRESLRVSGFQLDNENMAVINKVLTETGSHFESINELLALRKAFREILMQAKDMKVEYYKELEIVAKKMLGHALAGSDIFLEQFAD